MSVFSGATPYLLLFLSSCTNQGEKSDSRVPMHEDPEEDTPSGVPAPLGGCVYVGTDGQVPDNLYQRTQIVQSDAYPPFTKALTVNGITLLGRDDNEDAFMEAVATTIQELFPTDGGEINSSLQQQVLRSMYEHRTVIPLFKGDDNIDFTNNEWNQFELMAENNSLCDVIFEFGGQGQTMEVMEHVLHHVTMVGLHYTFYDKWGVSRNSMQHDLMQEAIDNGFYNQNYANEIDDPDEALRVTIQEYAYWVITTGFDLQTQFGPNENEWTLTTPQALENGQPQMMTMFNSTIPKVMQVPSRETLAFFEN